MTISSFSGRTPERFWAKPRRISARVGGFGSIYSAAAERIAARSTALHRLARTTAAIAAAASRQVWQALAFTVEDHKLAVQVQMDARQLAQSDTFGVQGFKHTDTLQLIRSKLLAAVAGTGSLRDNETLIASRSKRVRRANAPRRGGIRISTDSRNGR